MENNTNDRAKFHAITESTHDEWQLIWAEMGRFARKLPDRIVAQLALLRGDSGGFPVDRLEHCLQTATRAHQAGRDEEYVVCALLHDIGDWLGPRNHPDVAAAIVQPFTASSRGITSSTSWGSIGTCAKNSGGIRISRRRRNSAACSTRSPSIPTSNRCR